MAIRKRSALLLGALGFISGVFFAQYQRRRLAVIPPRSALPVVSSKTQQIPMQVVDQTLANARQNRTDAGYTTH